MRTLRPCKLDANKYKTNQPVQNRIASIQHGGNSYINTMALYVQTFVCPTLLL